MGDRAKWQSERPDSRAGCRLFVETAVHQRRLRKTRDASVSARFPHIHCGRRSGDRGLEQAKGDLARTQANQVKTQQDVDR